MRGTFTPYSLPLRRWRSVAFPTCLAPLTNNIGNWLAALFTKRSSVLKVEREFNHRAGFTNEDDRLARFFYEEPLPPHNKVVLISDEMMDSTFDF